MKVILDAGALLVMERATNRLAVILRHIAESDERALTHGGVLAQVWRGGHGRQAPLAKGRPRRPPRRRLTLRTPRDSRFWARFLAL